MPFGFDKSASWTGQKEQGGLRERETASESEEYSQIEKETNPILSSAHSSTPSRILSLELDLLTWPEYR